MKVKIFDKKIFKSLKKNDKIRKIKKKVEILTLKIYQNKSL